MHPLAQPTAQPTTRPWIACALVLAGAFAAPLAQAQAAAYGLHYGKGRDTQRLTLNTESAPVWSTPLGIGRLDLTRELGVAYWHAERGAGSRNMLQLNAIPMFRWWATDRIYLEGGIGLTLLSTTRFAGRELSTAFQFGDHLGLGFQLTPQTRLGARISHFSNGSIKSPNAGLDVNQITLTHSY